MDSLLRNTINTTLNANESFGNNTGFGNHTGYSDLERKQLNMYAIFTMTVGSLIIITNLIVVISSGLIIKTGKEPKSAYMQLGNASLAHMFIGASVIFGVGLPKMYRSHNLCVLQIGMIVSGTVTSIYSVGLVAVDRFIYILHNHHHKKWATTSRVRISILLAWIIGIVLGYMPITGWAGDTLNGQKCWYIKLTPPPLLIIISAIGFIPVLVVCVLYSIILYHALKKVKQLKHASETHSKNFTEEDNSKLRVFRGKTSNESFSGSRHSVDTTSTNISSDIQSVQNLSQLPKEPNQAVTPNGISLSRFKKNKCEVVKVQKNKLPTKWKAIKVVLLTTGSFACTWVPYFIASLIYVMCMDDEDQKKCTTVEVALASPLAMLGMLNSLINPVIYAWWHNGFKSSLKNIFLKKIKIFKINKSNLRNESSKSSSSRQVTHDTSFS